MRARSQTMLCPLAVFALQHHRAKAADNGGRWVAGPSPTTCPVCQQRAAACQQSGGRSSLTVPCHCGVGVRVTVAGASYFKTKQKNQNWSFIVFIHFIHFQLKWMGAETLTNGNEVLVGRLSLSSCMCTRGQKTLFKPELPSSSKARRSFQLISELLSTFPGMLRNG